MAQRLFWGLPDGMETWPVLHRVLLATNVPALRSGYHESSLDCAPRNICSVGARCTQTLVFGASIRLSSGRVWDMDALFTANRRVNACIVARNDDAQQTRIRYRRGQKERRQSRWEIQP